MAHRAAHRLRPFDSIRAKVLAWWSQSKFRSDPQHQLVDTALARLASQGTILQYTHQNIAELWNAMTRPLARNGLGLTIAEAERQVRAIEAGMTSLPDSEAVYREWRRIVVQHGVSGVEVHDARLAAAMYVHG